MIPSEVLTRIPDNTTVDGRLPDFCDEIVGKTLGELQTKGFFVYPEQLANHGDLDEKQQVFTRNGDRIRTHNVVGFVGSDDHRLTITSRFSGDKSDFLLRYLLTKVLATPAVVAASADLNIEDDSRLMISYVFAFFIRRATRHGLYKSYVKRQENDAHIRGPIDLPRHIQHNVPFVGKVAYNYRELTADNQVLQLINYVAELLRHEPGLAAVKDELARIGSAIDRRSFNLKKLLNWNERHPVIHAYYREYRELQRFCIWFVRYHGLGVGDGQLACSGMLFDIADLWEEYLNTQFTDAFYHPNNRTGVLGRRLLRDDDSVMKYQGLVFPDFVSRSAAPRVIMDAKYKPLENIAGDDLYRMLVYLFRFESKRGIFVHPLKGGAVTEQDMHMYSGFETSGISPVVINKIGMPIPVGCHDYSEFVEKMDENVCDVQKRINNLIKLTNEA